MAREKDKTLTTRFDSQTMAELNVSVEILGFRSLNALIHQLVMQKIREAKNLVSAEEFAALVEVQKEESQRRSEMKSSERKQIRPQQTLEIIGELLPKSKKKIPLLGVEAGAEKKKRSV